MPARRGRCRRMSAVASGWPEPVSNLFVAPLGAGADRPTGFVAFGLSPRLPFDRQYREYLVQIAQQITHAQARIEAFHVRAVAESERNNLLEQAPVATALMTGPRHVFQLANPLFLQIVGRRDIVGKGYVDAFPELRGTRVARHPRSRLPHRGAVHDRRDADSARSRLHRRDHRVLLQVQSRADARTPPARSTA